MSQKFQRTAVAYVTQVGYEYALSQKIGVCNNCFTPAFEKSPRRCIGCNLSAYCSKECQKQDWRKHKKFCILVQGKGKKNAYLSDMDRESCFQTLIDSYRLRVETDHVQRGEDHGIYHSQNWQEGFVWANGDAYADFQNYLDSAEGSGILPEWWNFETRMECLSIAVDEYEPHSIFNKIDQNNLPMEYNDDVNARTTLFILAELVVGYEGKGPQDDTWFREFQKSFEENPERKAAMFSGTEQVSKIIQELESRDSH